MAVASAFTTFLICNYAQHYVHEAQHTLFELPETNISFSIFAKAGGRNPQELDDDQMLQVGRLLGRMHNVGALQEARHRLRLHPESFTRPSLQFLLDGSFLPQNLSGPYQSLVEQIINKSSPLFESVPQQRIHGDAHMGNLLWGREDAFWVDFDDMLMGPCVQDIWLVVPGRDEYAKLNLLLEGYEQFREFDYQTLRLIEPLRAMRIIHFNAWIAKRWGDPAFRKVFVTFGSNAYWQEQIHALEEQLEVIGLQTSS